MRLHCFITVILFLACHIGISQTIPVIPLNDAYKKQLTLTTNDFIESITYIPIETSQSCLIDAGPRIDLTKDQIIITNNNKCLLFDRSSGKFIREIGKYGRGPSEYQATRGGFFNDLTSNIYFLGWKGNLVKYSLEGKQIGSIPIPNFKDSFTEPFFPENFNYVDNNSIACNIFNSLGTQKTLIMIFDEKGKQIGSVPNHNITKEHKFSLTTGELRFYHFNDKLLYHHRDNDTIFYITQNKEIPYLIIASGKSKKSQKSKDEAVFLTNYLESQRFNFFNFKAAGKEYFSLYDKSNSSLKAIELTNGITNTTDNFLPFRPIAIHNEEIVGTIQCTDLISWFEKNPDLKEKLPQDLKQLSLKQATDNPVIVIAKLKK